MIETENGETHRARLLINQPPTAKSVAEVSNLAGALALLLSNNL